MPKYDVPEYGYELPDDPKGNFEPKEILHYVLVMDADGSSPPFKLKYSLNEIAVAAGTDVNDIDKYVSETKPQRGTAASYLETPWDIPVNGQQCWVVLDLDPNWENWQFIGLGLTTKKPNNGKDFGLYWVTKKPNSDTGSSNPWRGNVFSGPIGKDGCKRIYFGVARRKKKESGCSVNFFTGFLHSSGKIMPVIYDPDVPNQGNGLPPSGGGGGNPGSGNLLIASKGRGEDVLA